MELIAKDLLGVATCGGSLVGVHSSSVNGGKAPVRTEPLPTIPSNAVSLGSGPSHLEALTSKIEVKRLVSRGSLTTDN
jgi:hypothetical protein